jgi:hypothetical protein
MKNETFLFTRTMRDIKTGFDIARKRDGKIKTTAQLMRGNKQIQPKLNERQVAIALEQEKRRFARQREALERGRKKVNAYREKLAGTIEKNKRIMALRAELQKQYWKREDEPIRISKGDFRRGGREIKLSY